MTPIKINRVANQQPMHPAPQICPVVLCHQRKMVAHQNKTQNRRLKPLRRLTDQFEEARAIVLIAESRLRRPHADLTKHLLSALSHADETHSGSILFACVDNSYLLLHFDRICSKRGGRWFQSSELD